MPAPPSPNPGSAAAAEPAAAVPATGPASDTRSTQGVLGALVIIPAQLARPRCQYEGLPIRAVPPLGVLRPARLAREHVRERLSGVPAQGRPSRYAPGDWVRVRSAEEVRATLDEHDRHRGLWFTGTQWSYCGQVLRVEHVVRRMLDDHYRWRRVSGTVTLAGGVCAGHDGVADGCGMECALLFRDEWLEPAAPLPPTPGAARWAVVRPAEAIRATLDAAGTLHGVPFHAGMAALAGRRLPVREATPRPLPWWQSADLGWFVLDGARCQGEPLAPLTCDRQCALLWHHTWLDFP